MNKTTSKFSTEVREGGAFGLGQPGPELIAIVGCVVDFVEDRLRAPNPE
jgi:hypothetical protein